MSGFLHWRRCGADVLIPLNRPMRTEVPSGWDRAGLDRIVIQASLGRRYPFGHRSHDVRSSQSRFIAIGRVNRPSSRTLQCQNSSLSAGQHQERVPAWTNRENVGNTLTLVQCRLEQRQVSDASKALPSTFLLISKTSFSLPQPTHPPPIFFLPSIYLAKLRP
jgi:hypothetical protein